MATLEYLFGFGRIDKPQINVQDCFNVPDTLMQRGFENVTEGDINQTLLPHSIALNGFVISHQLNDIDFIKKFSDKKFRLEIRNMVYGLGQNRTPSMGEYEFEASLLNQQRYTSTVELLIAFLCVKELKALSASFGVKIKNSPDGGDFDCIANFHNSLFHFEVKSGDVKNINEATLQSFLHRHLFLAPDASILFLDYQSRNGDELDKLMLKFKNLKIGAARKIEHINKVKDGSKKFYTLDSNLIVVDLHNNEDILENLRSAMQYFHRYNSYRNTREYHLIEPSTLGYESEALEKFNSTNIRSL